MPSAKKPERKRGLAACDCFFGHSIKLNYAGSQSYGTACGALVSILIVISMLAFVAIHIKLIFFRYIQTKPEGMGLMDGAISTVTTYDPDILLDGYELGDELFQISIGVK